MKQLKNRKTLTLVLCLILVSVFTLTIAYAALNAVLTIQGSSQVSSAEWDIHLANPVVKSGSATTDEPTLTNGKSLTFSTTLNMPGDFYEFTVDVINAGSIDAMIEKVTKTPELTADQAKYLKYEVSYANGEELTTKQLVKKNSSVSLKIRVEYRRDINSSDLSISNETLNLGLQVDYIQSDGSNDNIIVGNIYETGKEICFDTECFYVISSDENTVTMLAKYNLHLGHQVNSIDTYGEPSLNTLRHPMGNQDATATAASFDENGRFTSFPWIGTVAFSTSNYWANTINSYPYYVYDSNSALYLYLDSYEYYLDTLEITLQEIRVINQEDLTALGCNLSNLQCDPKNDWLLSTSYWTGIAYSDEYMYFVGKNIGIASSGIPNIKHVVGVRPVIVISKDYFN